MHKHVLPLVAALAFTFGSSAFAAAAPDAVPPVMKMATKAGLQVVKSFPASGGLTGWVLVQDGQHSLAYTLPDGKHLLVGALIGEDGRNLTNQHAEKFIPKPVLNVSATELDALAQVVTGPKAAKSHLYAFFDPNCIFCHFAWKALQPYEAAGLAVHWIPVAFLREDSMAKAAAILSDKNPAAALDASLKALANKKQAAVAGPAPTESLVKAVNANGEFMHRMGAQGTPAFIYFDGKGKPVLSKGMPRLSDLPTMTGLPKQANNDPELARFN